MDQIQAAAQGQGDHREAHRGEPRHLSSPPPGFLETVAALPITVLLHPWGSHGASGSSPIL